MLIKLRTATFRCPIAHSQGGDSKDAVAQLGGWRFTVSTERFLRERIGSSDVCVYHSKSFFEEALAMKMLLAVASVLVLTAAPAFAAEGQVSDQSLAKMGLSGMQTMSDNDGMQVRGLSIAVVGGFSTASVPGASSTNFYFAAGHHSASGNNASVAGSISGYHVTIVGAGGFSSAHAY